MLSQQVVNVTCLANVVLVAVEQIIVAGITREDTQLRSFSAMKRLRASVKAPETSRATDTIARMRVAIISYKIQLRGNEGDEDCFRPTLTNSQAAGSPSRDDYRS